MSGKRNFSQPLFCPKPKVAEYSPIPLIFNIFAKFAGPLGLNVFIENGKKNTCTCNRQYI